MRNPPQEAGLFRCRLLMSQGDEEKNMADNFKIHWVWIYLKFVLLYFKNCTCLRTPFHTSRMWHKVTFKRVFSSLRLVAIPSLER